MERNVFAGEFIHACVAVAVATCTILGLRGFTRLVSIELRHGEVYVKPENGFTSMKTKQDTRPAAIDFSWLHFYNGNSIGFDMENNPAFI